VLEAVKKRRRVAWMILINDVQVQSLEGNVLTLGFARDGDMKGFTSSGCDSVVEDALKEVLAVSWRVMATLGGGGQGAPPASAPPAAPPTPPAAPGNGPPSAAPSPPPASGPPAGTPKAPPSPPRSERPAVRPASPASPPRTAAQVPDEPDPDNDADADPAAEHLSGMALIQRELGATVIEEFDRA